MLQDFDLPVPGGLCERNYHLTGRMFWKSGISQKAFFSPLYNSAPLQRYVENGSSQVFGCECALQKEISLTETLVVCAQCVPA